jgi:arsenate reductase (thioredoxin)
MSKEKKVIFVCQHGAGKSVIAAAYFNKMAKERNLNYIGEYRGVAPDSAVSPSAKEGLIQDNVFDPNAKPQKFVSSETENVERIILFTQLPEAMPLSIKTENWSKIENVDGDYITRRDAIVKKLDELLDSIEK